MIADVLGAASLTAVLVVGVALVAAHRRLHHLEQRLAAVHDDLQDLARAAARASTDSQTALATARNAASAAGLELTPPRLALEPVTGPVVKAVAIGAGARRALARLAGGRDRSEA